MNHNATKYFGAALLALALLVVPALAATSADTHQGSHMPAWVLVIGAAGLAGAVTVTYKYPVSGTTPPTAIQSSQFTKVTGIINWLESDTLGFITHNFNVATAAGFAGIQPSIASFFPECVITPSLNSGTVFPNIQIDYTTATGNQLPFFKGSTAGTGGTVVFTVHKPNSLGN